MKKHPPEERKPDLNDPAEEAVEKRVDAMMDVEAEDAGTVSSGHPEAEAATAPLLADAPKPKEPIKVTVKEHKEDEELQTAIELANQQLMQRQADTEPTPQTPDAESREEEPPLPEVFQDEKTGKAVDEIVAEESDALLAAEDAARKEETEELAEPARSKWRAFLTGWWRHAFSRWAIIIFTVAVIGAAAALPSSRYMTLNALGVRSGASVQVIDQSTLQPLKDVRVRIADQAVLTDSNGKATFSKLKLGTTQLAVEKRAFSPVTRTVTLGWGSNPLGSFNLTPVGTQYAFVVTDYLSGKPVAKVAASAGDADANSDEKGKIRLTMEHREAAGGPIEVTLGAEGYREEKITLDAGSKLETAIQLVPARKEVFISKRSGKYDVYKIDIDGKNEQLVLAGTGSERDDLSLVPHPTENIVALVSSRDNKRNQDGYLLTTLTLIDLKTNSTRLITQSEQIQVANWIGDRLVYVQMAAGASAANPNRQRLMSYDHKQRDNKQLASANYFNDVLIAGRQIYYAPSNAYAGNQGSAFFKIGADGTGKQQLLGKETWNLFRSSYDRITVSVPNEWYEYRLGSNEVTKLEGQPANLNGRIYIDSADGKHALWVDNRDGKGVLLLYNTETKSERVLRTQAGLKTPVRWLTERVIIYRINNDGETADYALSLDGGEPKKITDVTNTGGVDRWYYY